MPRLRDERTGVVVDVDDATAERLASTHKPVSKPAAKKAAAKPSSDK